MRLGSGEHATEVAVAAAGLALLGSVTTCAVKCPDPWDKAVPASAGGAVALLFLVAIATADWKGMGAFHRTAIRRAGQGASMT
jgi:hypothetical protein